MLNDVGVCGTPFVSGRVFMGFPLFYRSCSSPESSRLGPDERWIGIWWIWITSRVTSQVVDVSPVTAVNITKKHLELAWKASESSFHHFLHVMNRAWEDPGSHRPTGIRKWHGTIGDFHKKSGSGQFNKFHNSGRNLHNFLAVTIFQFS